MEKKLKRIQVEIPEDVYRILKYCAKEDGRSLRRYIPEILTQIVRTDSIPQTKTYMPREILNPHMTYKELLTDATIAIDTTTTNEEDTTAKEQTKAQENKELKKQRIKRLQELAREIVGYEVNAEAEKRYWDKSEEEMIKFLKDLKASDEHQDLIDLKRSLEPCDIEDYDYKLSDFKYELDILEKRMLNPNNKDYVTIKDHYVNAHLYSRFIKLLQDPSRYALEPDDPDTKIIPNLFRRDITEEEIINILAGMVD